jgi:hypothetical protein
MDWTFHYVLSKKVFCKDIVNDSNIRFTRDSRNYLQDFHIQVNNNEFADAEIISKKKRSKIERILTIKSGMEIDASLSGYEGIPKSGGLGRVAKTLTLRSHTEGSIDALHLTDSNIQRLIVHENSNLEYLSSAVSLKYHNCPAESIVVGFKVIEDKNHLVNYSKYSCIRNIFSHNGPYYNDGTVNNFDSYFGQTNLVDWKEYDKSQKKIVLDLDSAKTLASLDKLAEELIKDAKTVLNL